MYHICLRELNNLLSSLSLTILPKLSPQSIISNLATTFN